MNDFQIVSKLGEGAYSTVYKVKRLVDGNIYALKKVKLLNLSEKEKLNALNEVRILASVNSNFVISYKEAFFDEKDSTLGIVMEFADRGDLYQKIVEHKKSAMFFEESDIWRIFIQLVKGLKALHELKILHRDLKSANVFLLSDGSAKLGDLNVSKVARRGLGYTQTGTPYYASPEVWKDQPYDNKSDIWSLGCVLYEMITLRPPFRAQNMEGLFNKVIKGQFNKIPERFSSDLFSIVQLLLQISPESRPSCEQILKHPIIQKRIEYFKSFSGEDQSEDKALLQTIHIPKNLLFLSDKLPKPNYDKHMKSNSSELNKMQAKNYRSYTNKKDMDLKPTNNDKKPGESNSVIKPRLLEPLKKVPENKNPINKGTRNDAAAPEKARPQINSISANNPSIVIANSVPSSVSMNGNKQLPINKMQADLPALNIISKKKIELNNMLAQRKKNLVGSHSVGKSIIVNSGNHLNDLYKIYAPFLNKPVQNRYNKIKNDRNKYYNINYNYVKNLERYYDNIHKLDYNYNLRINNSSSVNHNRQGPEIKAVPNKRLSPLKRNLINIC